MRQPLPEYRGPTGELPEDYVLSTITMLTKCPTWVMIDEGKSTEEETKHNARRKPP